MIKLHTKLIIPPDNVKALVVIVHGVGEHGGCYDELVEMFVSHSIGVFTYDQRGHGLSPGTRGHAAMDDLKSDLKYFVNDLKKKFSNIPIVILGHSMGGQLALRCAIEKDVPVQGAIAASPMIKLVNPPSRILLKIALWISRIAPCITIKAGIKSEHLAETTVEKPKDSKKDPLLHGRISLKLFTDLYYHGEKLIKKRQSSNMPVLLMHGTDDPLVSFDAGKLFAQKNKIFVYFKKWHKMRHSLLKDAKKEMVYKHLLTWIFIKVINRWNYSEQSSNVRNQPKKLIIKRLSR